MDNPKRILDDLAKELDGTCLEDTFVWRDIAFKIRLLNEEEANWRNGFVNTGSGLATLTSWRLPTLAIGIREIGGVSVFDFFKEEWEKSKESRDVVRLMEGRGTFSMKYFAAEHLMEYLGQRLPEAIEDLWSYWKSLEDRRGDAQANIKKSLGVDSKTEEKSSGTGSTPSGAE